MGDKEVDIDSELKKNEIIDAEPEWIEPQKNKKKKKRQNINLRDIEQQLLNETNLEQQRLLNLSKELNENKNAKNRLYDNESDGSSYYRSSDNEEMEDIERNKYKDSENQNDDDYVAERGVGKIFWGNKRSDYYGADAVNKRFKNKSEKEKYKELRDEEAIGIQMQKDEMLHQREKDFMDLEMQNLMEQKIENERGCNQRHIQSVTK